ncbi:MAG: ABC transporter ATP-binding protein [Candidatus Nanoperiomorbus sp.]
MDKPAQDETKQRPKTFWRNLRRTARYTKSSRKYVIIYIAFGLIEIPVSVIIPMLAAQRILDLTSNHLDQLLYTSLAVCGVGLFQNILNYIDQYVYVKLFIQIMTKLRMELTREALKLEVREIDKATTGLFITRINGDANDVSYVLGEGISEITAVLTRVGVMGAIFVVNKYMFIYALITALVTYAIKRRGMKREYEIKRKTRKLEEKMTGLTSEMMRGVRDIKVLNAGTTVLSKMSERIDQTNRGNFKERSTRWRHWLVADSLETLLGFLFVVLAVVLLRHNLITIPIIVIIFNYRNEITGLVTNITWLIDYAEQFNLAADRVYEVIDNKVFDKEKFGDIGLDHLEGKIEFDQVSFSYDHDDHKRPILDRISFTVRPNERVAFVGRSGAGKTTIFNLITRLYHADSGTIKLDGYDIESLTRDSIRDNMSIITQSPYIFNFSIKDNLLIAKPGASMREIRSVCQAACIDDYIMSLPEGYETMLGEGGVILSGGQRQRLAIARALLKKTEVILFDEATSALDNETQEQIQRAIGNLQGEYTILIVAHRLSTVIDSDRIFVVDKGKIVASGTHQELLRSCQFYHDLYRKDLV